MPTPRRRRPATPAAIYWASCWPPPCSMRWGWDSGELWSAWAATSVCVPWVGWSWSAARSSWCPTSLVFRPLEAVGTLLASLAPGGGFRRRAIRRSGMKLGSMIRAGLVAAGLVAGAATSAFAQGAPIKIGILHSLSGTMAISETTLKDVMLMLIEEQNKKGGVLGRKLEAVVVDPASNWP